MKDSRDFLQPNPTPSELISQKPTNGQKEKMITRSRFLWLCFFLNSAVLVLIWLSWLFKGFDEEEYFSINLFLLPYTVLNGLWAGVSHLFLRPFWVEKKLSYQIIGVVFVWIFISVFLKSVGLISFDTMLGPVIILDGFLGAYIMLRMFGNEPR